MTHKTVVEHQTWVPSDMDLTATRLSLDGRGIEYILLGLEAPVVDFYPISEAILKLCEERGLPTPDGNDDPQEIHVSYTSLGTWGSKDDAKHAFEFKTCLAGLPKDTKSTKSVKVTVIVEEMEDDDIAAVIPVKWQLVERK